MNALKIFKADPDNAAALAELERLATSINARERKSRADRLRHAQEQGNALLRAKALCEVTMPGQFVKWLDEHITAFTRSRAYHFMQFAEFLVTRKHLPTEEKWKEWQRISGNTAPGVAPTSAPAQSAPSQCTPLAAPGVNVTPPKPVIVVPPAPNPTPIKPTICNPQVPARIVDRVPFELMFTQRDHERLKALLRSAREGQGRESRRRRDRACSARKGIRRAACYLARRPR
jgi:hypothetical protein